MRCISGTIIPGTPLIVGNLRYIDTGAFVGAADTPLSMVQVHPEVRTFGMTAKGLSIDQRTELG